jgi:hypothetical protein
VARAAVVVVVAPAAAHLLRQLVGQRDRGGVQLVVDARELERALLGVGHAADDQHGRGGQHEHARDEATAQGGDHARGGRSE